ncbi:MAG: GNAT family N-acetyltransferase [Bdellovibrio sp.]|nr:MAG: GNAT family N-acetyltransferase [Bdellovibrio sp.]
MNIRPVRRDDLPAIKGFTDREIGANYYSTAELELMFERSRLGDTRCTLILEDESGEIRGIRITYPPGQWEHGKGEGLKPELWPFDLKSTAYFQSLFIAGDLRGQGWGGRMSAAAIRLLREAGVKGIVCHSWKESPNNSSTRYLQKLGFQMIAEHKEYWRNVNYQCTRCGNPPCRCTAQEMYLILHPWRLRRPRSEGPA